MKKHLEFEKLAAAVEHLPAAASGISFDEFHAAALQFVPVVTRAICHNSILDLVQVLSYEAQDAVE